MGCAHRCRLIQLRSLVDAKPVFRRSIKKLWKILPLSMPVALVRSVGLLRIG